MNLRTLLLTTLLLTSHAASAQNNLFSTSTTAPATNAAPTSASLQVLAGAGTFSLKDEYALYRGDVRVNDAQFFLSCESLRLNLDLKTAKSTTPASTNAIGQPLSPLTAPMGGRVSSAVADGKVFFSNKVDGSQAFAAHVNYFATNDAFELTGNARFIKGTITNMADKILFYRAKGVFEAVGNVRTEGSYSPTNNATKKP